MRDQMKTDQPRTDEATSASSSRKFCVHQFFGPKSRPGTVQYERTNVKRTREDGGEGEQRPKQARCDDEDELGLWSLYFEANKQGQAAQIRLRPSMGYEPRVVKMPQKSYGGRARFDASCGATCRAAWHATRLVTRPSDG